MNPNEEVKAKNLDEAPSSSRPAAASEVGMTLIEIIFAVTLILIMTIATASVIRSGIDMRVELSQKAKVNHRLMVAMQRLVDDLQQAYILDSQRVELNYVDRTTKSLFSITPASNAMELKLTTMSHQAIYANAPESDQTFVHYKLEKDNKTQLTHLFRADAKVIPTNFDEEQPLQILAKNIKSFKIYAWNGDDWREEWNSNKSDWRNMLPRLVRVEIEAFAGEPLDETRGMEDSDPTIALRTVVFIPRAVQNREPKEAPKSVKYY